VTSPASRLVLLAVLGGALGGTLRHLAEVASPDRGSGFPWTIFAVNVVGSGLLALVPALAVVRRSHPLTVFLGPGVLGGFTTMSTASEQTRALLADGHALVAAGYVGATLAAALGAVWLVSRFAPPPSAEVEA
jgi:CrcB protein